MEDSLELILELAIHDEEQLAHRANWLDTKTGAVLGFAIVSVAELLGFLLLASREGTRPNSNHQCSLLVFFVTGLIAMAVAMVLGLWEMAPMGFKYGAATELLAGQTAKSLEEIRRLCIEGFRSSAVVNRAIVKRKALLTKWTAIAVGVALLCYTFAVVILYVSLF